MARIAPGCSFSYLMDLLKNSAEGHSLEGPEHDKTSHQEPKVTDTVGDESFAACQGVFSSGSAQQVLVIPESDQQEGTQTDPFPAHKEHQIIISCDQDHHGGDKQIKENKEALIAAQVILKTNILMHVANSIDMDQSADPGDHQHHGRR